MSEGEGAPNATRWQPSIGDLMAIIAIVMGVVVYLTQPDWKIGGFLVFVAIALVTFAALRHPSHSILRTLVAVGVVGIFIALIWRPIWTSFHKDYPRIALNWPITLNPALPPPALPSNPPDMPPLNLPGPPLSKWGKAMFLCESPTVPADPRGPEAIIADIKRSADIFGNALGLSLVFNQIPYGFRFDVTANGTEGELRLGGVQRFTIQVERATQGIFVTATMDMPLGILSMMPIERDSDSAKLWAKIVAQSTGIPEDKCRML